MYVINTLERTFWIQITSVWRWWKEYNPVPTLQTDESCKPHCTFAVYGSIAQLRKRHRSRPFQVDKYARSKKEDTFTSVSHVTDLRVKVNIAEKIRMGENNNRINIYKSVRSLQKIQETTLYIKISADIRVKFFHNNSPISCRHGFEEWENKTG